MAMALCCAILLVTTTIAATHPPLPGPGKNELLPGLTSSQTYDAWMTNLLAWRRDTRIKLNLNTTGISAIVRDFPVISKWATETIVQPQVHIYDRYLWNETLGTFTVDVYLDDLRQRYGGIDSVLLWAGYPNLGIDERNQLDLLRLADIDIVAQQLRERGVHVLIGYNPWDSATRREPYDDAVALAKNLPLLNVEGFNGDTMAQIPREFWNATLEEHAKDPSVPPLVFEPEGGGYGLEFGVQGLGSFDYDIAGWGYMQAETLYPSGLHVYDMVPGVDRAKWLTTDGMRLTHVCDRWQKSRSDAILLAFFNGIGYESWENVWGIWNGMTKRDGELLRRMATLLRWTSTNNLTRGYQEDGWRPHTKDVTRVSSRVHASRFVGRGGSVLYTMVNLDDKKACNVHVSPPLITKGWDAYDLYNGVQLERSKGSVLVCVEGRGVSAVLFLAEVGGGVRVTTLSDLDKLLTTMASMTHSPLSTFDPTWHVLPQQMVGASTSTTDPVATTHAKQILIPRCTNFSYQAAGVEIEGDCDAENDPHNVCCTGTCNIFLTPADNITGHQNCQCAFPSSVPGVNGGRGVDVQFPWEGRTMGSFNGPRRNHNQLLDLGPFLMDKYPVTREEYSDYLSQTSYVPKDNRGFLTGWEWNEKTKTFKYPNGTGRLPVTSLSLSEARRYCSDVGKRLPNTYEWQYAAQGDDGRRYPWGDVDNKKSYPARQHPTNGATDHWTGLSPVDAHDNVGSSPFGVSDLIGNVWQWTSSEFRDEHTRRVIVRGTSSYLPRMANVYPAPLMIADWYFAPAFELDKHAIWLLMKDSYDRATTIGFRCIEDVKGGAPPPYFYR